MDENKTQETQRLIDFPEKTKKVFTYADRNAEDLADLDIYREIYREME